MAVMRLLMPVAGLLKVQYLGSKVDIDSPFFKLHYRTTASLCFICCLLVTANDLWGSTIDCMVSGVSTNVVNTFCWITSTFTIPGYGKIGEDFPHPGVKPKGEDEVRHAYYQWVPFVLFLQGIMFYIPHYLWKMFEDRKLDKITNGLRGRTLNANEHKYQCQILANYVTETIHLHNFYAFKYFVCDLLNFINVIGQMYLLNSFFSGVFMTFGTDLLYWSEEQSERNDPMIEVFPRITKCSFYKYGSSGTIEEHDAMCLLALNIINEKIFVALWFWFICLAMLTGLYLIYVLTVITLPSMRKLMIERNSKHKIEEKHLNVLMKRAQFGDWFVIFLISKNVESTLFKKFLLDLTENLETTMP